MEKLIVNFYKAFNELDFQKMAESYHPDAIFEDPAFGRLEGKDIGLMWEMLCKSQKADLFEVLASDIVGDDSNLTAHWEASYLFSKTSRKVHNKIDASFEFKDGLIYRHTDHFDLRKWATMALGFQGWLVGGTGFFQRKLHQQTKGMLEKYKTKKASEEASEL